ncbi:cyclic nucleotide-binding domain protein [Pseudomonas aeruginosa]|uniref:Pycsar phage resistance system effector protein PycTIR n=1 Tax=Pseudomonas aeruginosa TaxID=287 RepID=UPI0005498C75|nr:Pycsar phage resistance system effector protein PycTIR [Pseudomonas aeruginosa]CEI03303.1 cyclic nucleotide-binding domain protein [Pseudomonas aeruginosa]
MTTGKLIDRFEGPSGRAVLEEVLLEQKLVLGNQDLARRLAEVGTLEEIAKDAVLITEDAEDSEVYFIITGHFQVKVHDREVATRGGGDHVGEMAALVPTAKRSATVLATEPSIVLKVSAADFKSIADAYPSVWRQVTRQLVDRLHQRNDMVLPAHQSSDVFIICSVEALPIARAIENNLEHDKFFVKTWTQGVFRASQYALESLEEQLDECDFAIAIAQPDDSVTMREETKNTPRDNVIFELGLFVGRLGRARTFLLEPRGDEVHLPSDLKGLTTIGYRLTKSEDQLPSSLSPACNQLRTIFNKLGPK